MAQHPNIITQVDHSRPHQPDNTCGKCKRKLEPYHRVGIAYIVKGNGADPLNLSRKGIFLYKEFEFTHIDCKDPMLVNGGN